MPVDDRPTLPPDDVQTQPVIFLDPQHNTAHLASESVRPEAAEDEDIEHGPSSLAPDTERDFAPNTERGDGLDG